jgi:hypothetical protein
MSLFDLDLPSTKNQKELDQVFLKHPEYDRYYLATGCIENRKILLDRLWA